MWQAEIISDVGKHDIQSSVYDIADGTTPAVRIPDIYTDEELAAIVGNIDQQGVLWYPNFEGKQGRIGICATEYAAKKDGKEEYFAREAEASDVRDKIFSGGLDPVKKMIDIFSQGFDASIAVEPSLNNARYFTGLIRAMAQESSTHFDYAPHQLPGWEVADSPVQFAVVTYLQMPDNGGGLTVYNRLWQPEDDEYDNDTEEKGPEGFEREFIDGEESVTIMPSAGEMIVFNSRNFHRVEGIGSEVARYSINSFMSLSDDSLRFWN